jgi:hypothetical protein
MKTMLDRKMKLALVAFALHLGLVANIHAGGGSLLHLPIEGVTKGNRDQCAKLFEQKFGPVLINWRNGDVKMLKDGSINLVELRPERGQISLGDVEKVLKGSPFSIKREQLEYFSLVRLRIGRIADREKHVESLATLDGKKFQTHSVENADGSLWITLRDPVRNTAIPLVEKRTQTLVTHRRLTNYLSKHKINLIEISWGHNRRLDTGKFYREAWRGDHFGARPAATLVDGREPVKR